MVDQRVYASRITYFLTDYVMFPVGHICTEFCFTFKVTNVMKGEHWQWSHQVSPYDSV